MVPRERPHHVLNWHIEICGSSSMVCQTMGMFSSSVTVTGRLALWSSDVSPYPRLKRSIQLYNVGSETEDSPYTFVKTDWILITLSPSFNQVKM